MKRTWKYFLYTGITLFVIEAVVILVLYLLRLVFDLDAAIIIFTVNVALFFIFFFTFLITIKKKIFTSEQIVTHINKTAFRFSGLGICIFNYNKEIIWTNELIQEREKKSLIGTSILEWIPALSLILLDQHLRLKIKKDKRIYEIRLLKETSTILLHDITDYEVLLQVKQNESLVVGILFIGNLQQILSSENQRFQIKLLSIIHEQIASWSEEFNFFIKSTDKDNFLLVAKQSDYEKVIAEDKFSLIKNISTKSKAMISISIGLAYGINDSNLLYDLALQNLNKAISKGGNQTIAQNYLDKNLYIYGWDSETVEQITSLETKLFGIKLKESINNASNVLISGHKFADYDAIASSLALFYIAKFFGKEAKIVIDFNLLDNNAKMNINNAIPPNDLKNIYIHPSKVDKYFESNTLLIVADTHIKQRIEFPELLEKTKNVVVVDHHLLADGDLIKTNTSYIQHNASSTSEIIVEILSEFLTSQDVPEYLLNLLFTGILLDTNNFKVRTSQRTFETVALLKAWGAKPQIAQEMLRDDYPNILLKQSIIGNSFEISPGYICACGNQNTRIPRSIVAQIAQDLSEIKGIKAAFAIAYDDLGIANLSARSNGIINVQNIAKELGGGGHYNAAAAQQKDGTISDMLESLVKIILRKVNNENTHNNLNLKKSKKKSNDL